MSIKNLILSLVEEWKNNLLMYILRGSSQSVHGFAAAQVAWGEEFGLDVIAGFRDPNREGCGERQLTPERLEEFRNICNDPERLIDGLMNLINSRRLPNKKDPERTNNRDLIDASSYREFIVGILREQGFNQEAIDQKIEQFFPIDDSTNEMNLTKEAVSFILTCVGLLNN